MAGQRLAPREGDFMDWLIGALLVFLVVVGLEIALVASKPRKRNKNRCLYCGAELKVVAGQTTPICQQCGRQQPDLEHELRAHGRR
jgi:hypothetical protein